MKIRIIQDTVALRKQVKVGDLLDVSVSEGNLLIGLKKAEKVETISNEEAQESVDKSEAEIPAEAVVAEPKPKKKKGKE